MYRSICVYFGRAEKVGKYPHPTNNYRSWFKGSSSYSVSKTHYMTRRVSQRFALCACRLVRLYSRFETKLQQWLRRRSPIPPATRESVAARRYARRTAPFTLASLTSHQRRLAGHVAATGSAKHENCRNTYCHFPSGIIQCEIAQSYMWHFRYWNAAKRNTKRKTFRSPLCHHQMVRELDFISEVPFIPSLRIEHL